MSKADELIAGLQQHAQLDSEGAFSLDRDKAREKMRQFQLSDPHRYVLLLVEFATLRGARAIEFEIDADDMRMRCDAVLDYEDLDELYTSLFVDRSGAGIRARRELALACNAVMALNPKFVEITSFGPAGGVRALLRPDAPDEIAKIEAAQPNGTLIHVKDRFRPGLFVRFLRDSQGALPEELLLRERCRYATQSIVLEGTTLGAGLPDRLIAAQPFETEDLRGVGGIDPTALDRSGIVLLSNGVEIATHELRESVPGLWFWVDGRALRKDVSQNDVARGDPGYAAMLATIAGVRDRVLGELADAWQHGKFSAHTQPSADEVFKLLSRCFMRWATHEWLRPDAGPLGTLAELPLWRTTDERWLDSRMVAAKADPERGVLFSLRAYDGVVPEGWPAVLHPWSGDDELAAIRRVFVQVEEVTTELGRKVPGELARRAWRARPHEPRLPQGVWPVRMPFALGPHRGEVSLRPGRRTNVRVVVEGCLLHEVEFEGPLVGLSAVLEGPYEPLADFSRAKLDATWAEGLLLVLAQVRPLVEAWAKVQGSSSAEHLRGVLLSLADPSLPARWLEAFGFKAGAAMVARFGAPSLLPSFGLPTAPNELARFTYFDTLAGPRVSLVELDQERHARDYTRGKILVVEPDTQRIEGLAMHVVRASPEERRFLQALFGEAEVHDDTATLQAQLARREFLARPKITPTRPQPSTAWIAVEAAAEDEIRGFVAIDAAELRKPEPSGDRKGDKGRSAKVELIVEERRVGLIELPCLLPGVRASLVWPGASLDASFSHVSGSLTPLSRALHRGLAQLIRAQVQRCAELASRPAGDLRRLIWTAIVGPFLGPELFSAWRWHRANTPDLDAAIAGYWPIFELFPTYPLDAITEALALLRSEQREPKVGAVLELLGEPKRGRVDSSLREFYREMLALAPTLEALPSFETSSRKSTTLAALLAAFDGAGSVAWLQDPSLSTRDDRELIVRLDPDDCAALHRLLGDDALVESSLRVREQQRREAFADQRPRERIELPDLQWLVRVEVAVDGFEGELGIPPWLPADSGSMSLEVCHLRRRVETVELHAILPVMGVLDDAHAEFEEPFVKLARASARMAALRKRVDEVINGQLLPRLAAGFEGLTPERRAIAWGWVTRYLLRTAEGAGDHPNRLGELGRRFAALRGFIDVDGSPRSLDELIARYQAQGSLLTLDAAASDLAEPIVRLRAEDEPVLPRLFASITDYAPLRREVELGQARRRKARAVGPESLPDPSRALVHVELDQQGLDGALWLPAEHPFEGLVELAVEGRVVERRALIEALPIAGLVLGDLTCDRGFTSATPSAEQLRYLRGRVVAAYGQLLDQHRAELDHPDRLDLRDAEAGRRRAARIATLRAAAIALTKIQLRGGPQDAIEASLRDRLAEAPLLEVASGRLISIAVGREVRPLELNHLELWDARDPASERFEAELVGALAQAGAQAEAQAKTAAAPAPANRGEVETRAGLAALAALMGFPNESPSPATPEPATPEPAPAPATPEPPPAPPPPDPVAVLLDAIRDELRLVRKGHESLLAEGLLDELRAETGGGRGSLVTIDGAVVFDNTHPCFRLALVNPDDPIWISFLASHAFTALNFWQDQVTDAHEQAFHARHAALLVSSLLAEHHSRE